MLAARIESSGVRGYTLETVPAGAAVPPDAKPIGTCESGARKILYRRWGATRTPSVGASAAAPAAAPKTIVKSEEPGRRTPGVQGERAARSTVAPASSAAAPPPVSRSDAAASAAPAPGRGPEQPAAASTVGADTARPLVGTVVAPAPTPIDTSLQAQAPASTKAPGLMAGPWPWLAGLGIVAAWGGVWVWRARYSAYDKDGLPRGPRF